MADEDMISIERQLAHLVENNKKIDVTKWGEREFHALRIRLHPQYAALPFFAGQYPDYKALSVNLRNLVEGFKAPADQGQDSDQQDVNKTTDPASNFIRRILESYQGEIDNSQAPFRFVDGDEQGHSGGEKARIEQYRQSPSERGQRRPVALLDTESMDVYNLLGVPMVVHESLARMVAMVCGSKALQSDTAVDCDFVHYQEIVVVLVKGSSVKLYHLNICHNYHAAYEKILSGSNDSLMEEIIVEYTDWMDINKRDGRLGIASHLVAIMESAKAATWD